MQTENSQTRLAFKIFFNLVCNPDIDQNMRSQILLKVIQLAYVTGGVTIKENYAAMENILVISNAIVII